MYQTGGGLTHLLKPCPGPIDTRPGTAYQNGESC
jgi:hypothetical protein